MRPASISSAVLILAAGAGGTGALAGCDDDSLSDVGVVASTTPTSPLSTVAATIAPTPADIPADRRDFGYVRGIEHRGGTDYLVFDRAIWYVGDEANRVAAARGEEDIPVPNDYYIVNDSEQLRRLPVAPDVTLVESIGVAGINGSWDGEDRRGPFSDLVAFVARNPDRARSTPFHLRYDAAGHVVHIAEQYVP